MLHNLVLATYDCIHAMIFKDKDYFERRLLHLPNESRRLNKCGWDQGNSMIHLSYAVCVYDNSNRAISRYSHFEANFLNSVQRILNIYSQSNNSMYMMYYRCEIIVVMKTSYMLGMSINFIHVLILGDFCTSEDFKELGQFTKVVNYE